VKRIIAALAMALLLLAGGGRWALAHAMVLFGNVSVDARGELVVRVVDAYGAAVEGQKVTASAAAPGARPTKPVELKEEPAGTYRGVVTAPGAESYAVTIELDMAGDLHRIVYNVAAGQSKPEEMIPMAQIDQPQGIPWSRVLYLAAAAVLVAATAVALLKKPQPAEKEE
jgi:hypothetical protein